MPITGPSMPSAARCAAPASRAASMPSSRIASSAGNRSIMPGAAQKFEVVEALVARNVAGLGHRDGVGEQQAAAIAIVADALGNAGQPGDQRGVEGVLQEDRAVEALRAKAGGELALARPALSPRVRDHAIDGASRGRRDRPPRAAPATARCACGKTRRMARMAGSDITASPSQLVARTNPRDMEDGLKATGLRIAAGLTMALLLRQAHR